MKKDKESIAKEREVLEDSKKLLKSLTGCNHDYVKFGETSPSDYEGDPISFNLIKRNLFDKESIDDVNFVVKLKKYITYEFETKDPIYVQEAETDCSLFRLFINEDGTREIMVANDDDFDIHEDVTHLFDVDSIAFECLSSNTFDCTDSYIEHYQERIESGEDLGHMDLTSVSKRDSDSEYPQYTITITTDHLAHVMTEFDIPVTDENITKLLKAKVLENAYNALDQQIHDEIKYMITDLYNEDVDLDDIDEIDFCDDCGKAVNKNEGEDFFFEVPKEHSQGLKPNAMVCEECWTEKGYEKVYEEYEEKNED